MNLSEWLQRIMVGFGAAWVMWLMLGLSVISVAIILERAWFFWSLKDDLVVLQRDLRTALDESIPAAQKRMAASPSAEAAVVSAGLVMADRGADAAEEAMAGALALQRMKLDSRLAYLGTLGNNAPFIGLFGTVIGVIGAFDALGQQAKQPAATAAAAASAMAPQAVMSNIAEALVATAVGLMVAIPAVAANNFFQRLIKSTMANTEALTRILLAHLKSEPLPAGGPYRAPPKETPLPAKAAKPAASKKAAKAPPPKEEPEEEDEESSDEEEAS